MTSDAAGKLRETTAGEERRTALFDDVVAALWQSDHAAARDAIRDIMADHPIRPEWDKFRQLTALMNRANATLEDDPSYNLAAADIPDAFAGLSDRWSRYWHLLETESPSIGNLMAATTVIQAEHGDPSRALGLAKETADRDDLDAASMNAVANILLNCGEFAAALDAYRKADALEPDNPAILSNTGRALENLDRLDEALAAHRRAAARMPQHPEISFNLGNLLTRMWLLDEAEQELRRTIAIKPDHHGAMMALANNLQAMRRCGEAADLYARVLRARPGDLQAWSNHLMNLPYLPTVDAGRILHEHRACAERLENGVARVALPAPDPGRQKIRVGYFAAYYRNHPAGWLSEAAIAAHDTDSFDICFYINNRSADGALDRLKPMLTAIRDISGLSDDAAAQVIAADHLDLLVDLSGHTKDNRIGVLARKPAPVIAAWPVSYWNTTGLGAVDYLIADPNLVPVGATPTTTETVLRLPNASVCYRPPADAPAVAALPMESRGFPTFGCFNRLAKVNNDVIRAWSAILTRLPTARLRLQCRSLDSLGVRADILSKFAENGVANDRIDLVGRRRHHEMLAEYAGIDLVLDPFPWTGSIVTCEAMWMGVPTVTLAGASIVSRYSLTYQSVAGLDGFAAMTVEDYIDLAVDWAGRPRDLGRIRERLRNRMAASPLCNAASFSRDLETLYRQAVSEARA
jgi:predicted O-linked N-acetylglucosamine transferase (SPINDLY family)